LKGACDHSQNGRGGMFFVVEDEKLFRTVSEMIDGDHEPFRSK